MDRLNKVHQAARVQLPKSVIEHESLDTDLPVARGFSKMPRYFGAIAFSLGGIALIAAASFLALNV